MNGVLAALRRQPVRTYLYGVLVPGVAVAGGYGWVSDDKAALWLALGAAVLLPFGVEAARAKVTPLARPRDDAGNKLVPVHQGKSIRVVPIDESTDVPCLHPECVLYTHTDEHSDYRGDLFTDADRPYVQTLNDATRGLDFGPESGETGTGR